MNYHQTNDYPIDLEDVFKMIGFANKGNATKTLENNFIKDEDYKIIKTTNKTNEECLLVRTEKQTNRGGHNKEKIMLNIDTFKSMCMIAKTPQGKEMRKYYVKLENINHRLISEELKEYKQLLIEQTHVYTKEKEQIWKNSFRNKYVVYLLIISENLIKFGFTKDIDTRLSAHKKDYGKNIQIAFIIESKNNEMLETSFKNHEKIKFNIVSQIFNGENKTELIKLDKNLSLKNVINVLTEANKFIDTIIETDIFKKYNVNLLNYQVQTPVQELQEVQEVQIPVQQEVLQPVQIPVQEILQPKQQVNKTIGSKCKELVKSYINARTEYSSKRSDYIFLDDLFEDFDIWFTSNTPNTANICSKLSFSRIISSEYITNRIATGPRIKNVTPRKNAIVNRKLI
jgi:phage anti-repressor protein